MLPAIGNKQRGYQDLDDEVVKEQIRTSRMQRGNHDVEAGVPSGSPVAGVTAAPGIDANEVNVRVLSDAAGGFSSGGAAPRGENSGDAGDVGNREIMRVESLKFVNSTIKFAGDKPKGLYVSFNELKYVVHKRKYCGCCGARTDLVLLQDITAYLQPSNMTALMGPSGSGKSTLMDVLAGRKTTGTISGQVLYGASPPTQSFLRRHTGYVEQFDTLCDNLTVYENLLYTAEMKLPMIMSTAEKRDRVDNLIKYLEVEKCRNTIVGNSLSRGISGGQAKRVNIGISVITDPQVLYLDEPTSGLDSFTSDEIMKYVKRICREGIAVCATIHSPSPTTFNLFDKLILLAGGRQCYFGPIGRMLIEHFQHLEFAQEIAYERGRDAEWVVQVVTSGEKNNKRDEMVDNYLNSELKKKNDEDSEKMRTMLEMAGGLGVKITVEELQKDDPRKDKATAVSMAWAIRKMFWYRVLREYKDPMFLGARLADKIISLGIIMTLFTGNGNDLSGRKVLNTSGALFMWCAQPAFSAAAYLPSIMLDRPLYQRERNDGLYYSYTYYIVKWLQELLLLVPSSLLFSGLIYVSVDLQGQFAVYWLSYLLIAMTWIAVAYTFATLCPTIDFANGAVPSFGGTLLFFVGFLVPRQKIPDWWIWYFYFDQMRYPWTAMMAENYGSQNATISGQSPLEYYGIENANPAAYVAAILPFLAFYALCGGLILKYIQYGAR